ncbi:hypothetical protein [Agarivorans sp. QJM3NY_25]|uniref:hypothetical protein n=1 Tax=Agarivorans sp. QJM3NY_25 TaxID=3421430 RepID=UPI003D7DEC00
MNKVHQNNQTWSFSSGFKIPSDLSVFVTQVTITIYSDLGHTSSDNLVNLYIRQDPRLRRISSLAIQYFKRFGASSSPIQLSLMVKHHEE